MRAAPPAHAEGTGHLMQSAKGDSLQALPCHVWCRCGACLIMKNDQQERSPHRCTLAELDAKQRHHCPKGAWELLVIQSIQPEHGRAHNICNLQHGHPPLKRQQDDTHPSGCLHDRHSCRSAIWMLSARCCVLADWRGHKAPLGAAAAHSSRHGQLGPLTTKAGLLQSPRGDHRPDCSAPSSHTSQLRC